MLLKKFQFGSLLYDQEKREFVDIFQSGKKSFFPCLDLLLDVSLIFLNEFHRFSMFLSRAFQKNLEYVFMLRRSNKAYRTGNVGMQVGLQVGRQVFKKSNMISVTQCDIVQCCMTELSHTTLRFLSLAEQCYTPNFHLRCFKSTVDAVKSKISLLIKQLRRQPQNKDDLNIEDNLKMKVT